MPTFQCVCPLVSHFNVLLTVFVKRFFLGVVCFNIMEEENVDYTCYECPGSVFNGPAALSTHIGQYHPTLNSFTCGQGGCRKSFIHKTSMMRHIKSYHFGDNQQASTSRAEPEATASQQVEFHGVGEGGYEDITADTVADSDSSSDSGDDHLPSKSPAEVMEDKAAQMILSLRSSPGITGSAVQRIQKHVISMFEAYSNSVKETLKARLTSEGLTDDDVSKLLKGVSIPNPFVGMETIEEQLDYFEKNFGLVKPEQKFLGSRVDKRLDSETNSFIQAQVPETFECVSLSGTLKKILSNKKLRKKIFRDLKSTDGLLRTHMDGAEYQDHPLLQEDNVIHILLYYDELEVANALGSKTVIHKLGVFFFQILNLPIEDLSELSSIHVVALCYADDTKKDGAFKRILTPLVQEMKRLSTPEGVQIELDGELTAIRALLVGLAADNNAAHDVMGLMHPSCKFFCRQCLVSRSELRANANTVGQPRTMELHAQHVARVKAQNSYKKQCGVKSDCPLRDIPYFDFTKSLIYDCFHELLEGVVPLVLKLVLREYIYFKKRLSVQDFNANIASFSYGIPDDKNKPSPNFTVDMLTSRKDKLKQTGSQMWCLLRAFPFLLRVPVLDGDRHMELIFLLQDICQIVFSPVLRHSDIDRLEILIEKHHDLFKDLFIDTQPTRLNPEPEVGEDSDGDDSSVDAEVGGHVSPVDSEIDTEDEVEIMQQAEHEENVDQNVRRGRRRRRAKKQMKVYMTNKMHQLKHFASIMRRVGPIVRFWCAKFEGRMKIFRQFAGICGSFKNIPKTMANMFQLATLGSLSEENDSRIVHHKRGDTLTVAETSYPEMYTSVGLDMNESLFITKSASVCGEDYRPGLFVCVKSLENVDAFALVKQVVVVKRTETVNLLLNPWVNNGLKGNVNAYCVTPGDVSILNLVNVRSLIHHRAIAPWTLSSSSIIYLSVRTLVV